MSRGAWRVIAVASIAVILVAGCGGSRYAVQGSGTTRTSPARYVPPTTTLPVADPTLVILGPSTICLCGPGSSTERKPFYAALRTADGLQVVPQDHVIWTVDDGSLASVDGTGFLTVHAECVAFTVRAEHTTLSGAVVRGSRRVSIASDAIPTGGCPSQRCESGGQAQGSIPVGRCGAQTKPVDIEV